jgi:hypothetical protein
MMPTKGVTMKKTVTGYVQNAYASDFHGPASDTIVVYLTGTVPADSVSEVTISWDETPPPHVCRDGKMPANTYVVYRVLNEKWIAQDPDLNWIWVKCCPYCGERLPE